MINKFNPFIIALQETWLRPNSCFKIPGFSCIREDRQDSYAGVALLIQHTFNFSHIPIPHHNNDYSIVAARVNNISFVSVYIPHPSSLIYDELEQILSSIPSPLIIMGDFNAQHQSWGSSSSNHYGNRIVDFLNDYNLCILNNGNHTRRTQPHEGTSAPDLSFCSPSLASSLTWSTLDSTYGSDHYPILITFPNIINKPPNTPRAPRLKYQLNNADWLSYREKVEQGISSLPHISEGQNICAEALAKLLIETGDDIFPIKNNTKGKIPSPPWWDKECSDAIKERKVAERAYILNSTLENLNILSEVSTKTRKLFKQKKWDGWKNFCHSISPNTPPSIVWLNIRKFRSAFKETRPCNLDDHTANNFLDKLAPPFVPLPFTVYETPSPSVQPELNTPFTMSELKGVLRHVKDSAPGMDGIPYSFLSHLNDSSLSYYLSVINYIMQSNSIPLAWKSQEVIPILKPNKPTSEATSYRPIALSSVLAKVAEHLVKNRLEWFFESKGLLSSKQFGFRKGRSTFDSLGIFTTDVRLAFSYNESLLAAFVDINAAYDNVVVSILKEKLIRLQVPTMLVNFIINMLSERVINVVSEDSIKSRVVWSGLPQGSVLSPLLFNIYTFDLEASFNNSVNILQFADDLVLYIAGKDIELLCSSLTSSLRTLKVWLDVNGLNLSVPKSTVVLFSRMRCPPPISVYFDGLNIPVKKEVKFLGIILDCKLSGLPHCYYISAKCERVLNILRCLTGVWWGSHPFNLKLLYNALVRSILDYGTFFLGPSSVVGLHKLDAIQFKALRIITGAMRSSPTNALQVECGEPPLNLRRQYLCDRFIFRTLQICNHPLYTKLQQLSDLVDSSPYWSHKTPPSPVISFRKFLSFEAPTHRSSYLPIFSINFEALILTPDVNLQLNIPKNPKYSNNKFNEIVDRNWQGWHYIFCDASKHSLDTNVGVGVYHLQYNITQKIKLPPESTVFTGECFGLLKSIEYVLLFKLNNSVVFTDSRSALEAICKFPFHKSNRYFPIVFECRKLLYECSLKGFHIAFGWVPSHCGILGNEKADRLANDAISSGDIFPYKNFCHDLVSLTKSFLWKTWQEHWDHSSQIKGQNYYKIQPIIPAKPWFHKCFLDKQSTSIITRMRLGHVCTPEHLAKLKIVPSNMCECGTDVGTLNHLFFACPIHDHTPFFESLVSLRIPLPSSIHLLLSLNNIDVYYILCMFIRNNNIKI